MDVSWYMVYQARCRLGFGSLVRWVRFSDTILWHCCNGSIADCVSAGEGSSPSCHPIALSSNRLGLQTLILTIAVQVRTGLLDNCTGNSAWIECHATNVVDGGSNPSRCTMGVYPNGRGSWLRPSTVWVRISPPPQKKHWLFAWPIGYY